MQIPETPKPEPLDDEPLDRLLRRAEWPLPGIDSTQRLSRQWESLSSRSAWSIWRPILAVAASVGLIFAAAWIFRFSAKQTVHMNQPLTAAIPLAPTETAARDRPATMIELAMLKVVNAQMRSSTSASVSAPPPGVPLVPVITGWSVQARTKAEIPSPPPADATAMARNAVHAKTPEQRDHLLDDLVALGPVNSTESVLDLLAKPDMAPPMIAALARNPQGWSDALFSALNDPHVLVRLSAARALAKIDGPVNTARLISMANADINRREAVTALVQIHSAEARQYVEAARQSSQLGAIVRSALAQNVGAAMQTGDIR